MKTFLLAFFALFVTATVFAQSSDCKKFKNGTFKMSYDGKIDTVIRGGGIQTELFNNQKKGTFTVKWLNNCTYTLTPTAETASKDPQINPAMVVTVSMTKKSETTYTQTITNNMTAETITMDGEKIK